MIKSLSVYFSCYFYEKKYSILDKRNVNGSSKLRGKKKSSVASLWLQIQGIYVNDVILLSRCPLFLFPRGGPANHTDSARKASNQWTQNTNMKAWRKKSLLGIFSWGGWEKQRVPIQHRVHFSWWMDTLTCLAPTHAHSHQHQRDPPCCIHLR